MKTSKLFQIYLITITFTFTFACTPKPDTNPQSTIYYTVRNESFPLVDGHLASFAKENKLKFYSGDVGSGSESNYTIHLIGDGYQIIGVNPFNPICFRVSFYKSSIFGRSSDEDIEVIQSKFVSALSYINGVKLITENEARKLDC